MLSKVGGGGKSSKLLGACSSLRKKSLGSVVTSFPPEAKTFEHIKEATNNEQKIFFAYTSPYTNKG
ncbi:hypothetical protein GA0061081_103235 [Gilliamella bombicola]|uniref:Uncharacterized protein n=1 Tax=Gilliamella bombicola TaxID=1798182 RepID=A0A1C4B1C6_9GAMM|nr:hypothetical protein [Gilliamella bombicola]SCC00691.1 hypothetical protein GA0061081_103235 [Gilliamella bombicola]